MAKEKSTTKQHDDSKNIWLIVKNFLLKFVFLHSLLCEIWGLKNYENTNKKRTHHHSGR